MAEAVYSPEVYSIKPPERGPMDRVKRKVFDFVKSQAPEAHARRTMERYDWVSDQLDGKSRELFETMRPAAEKAAKVAGVSTTAMEIIFATQVAAALAILGGKVGGDLLFNKDIRDKTVQGVKDVAGTASKESTTIVKGAYAKIKQGLTAGLGAIGAGGALEWLKNLGKRPAPDSAPGQPAAQTTKDSSATQDPTRSEENQQIETKLSPELDKEITELRAYAEAALAQSKMEPTTAGRVAMTKDDLGVILLIQERIDLAESNGKSGISMSLVDEEFHHVTSVIMTDSENRGSSMLYDRVGFASATRDIQNGTLQIPIKGQVVPRKFDDRTIFGVLDFIRYNRVELNTPPAA